MNPDLTIGHWHAERQPSTPANMLCSTSAGTRPHEWLK
jgi:hypothetical protein